MIDQIEKIFRNKRFAQLTTQAVHDNLWVIKADIDYAIDALRKEFLDAQKVERFIIDHSIDTQPNAQKVGIIAAGNLPLVGFADMFYSLLCGCSVVLKWSSKDPLMRAFDDIDGVSIVDTLEDVKGVDYLLSMGSDETCTLLKTLFATTPMLLRGSMHSIAILSGNETEDELTGLADDIFIHCSRGCRSVTHLYLPIGYEIEKLKFAPRQMPAIWEECYTYERARAIISSETFSDGGFYLLKPGATQAATTIGYSFYTDRSEIPTTNVQHIAQHGNFGRAQRPTLDDFANKQNVIDFLQKRI